MTIGQTTTDGTILDSIPLEGITISSDDGMLKPMLAQYSPTIRGIANSPARVIVKQNGNIIYEKNVPAGEFEFNDVTQVYNGDLKLKLLSQTEQLENLLSQLQNYQSYKEKEGFVII